jgi:hypothetical protein
VLLEISFGKGIQEAIDPQIGSLRGGADVRRERYIFGWQPWLLADG